MKVRDLMTILQTADPDAEIRMELGQNSYEEEQLAKAVVLGPGVDMLSMLGVRSIYMAFYNEDKEWFDEVSLCLWPVVTEGMQSMADDFDTIIAPVREHLKNH